MNKRFLSGIAALALVVSGAMAPISAAAEEEYDLEGNFSVDEGEFVFEGFDDDGETDDDDLNVDPSEEIPADITYDAPTKTDEAGDEYVEDGDFGIRKGFPKKDETKKDDTKKDETKTDDTKKDKKKAPKIVNPYDYLLPDEMVAVDLSEYPLPWGWGYNYGGVDYAKPVYGFDNTFGYLYGGVDYGKPTLANFGNYFFPTFAKKTCKKTNCKKKTTKKKAAKKCTKKAAPVVYKPVVYAPVVYKPVAPVNTWCKCFSTVSVPKKTGYYGKFFYNTFNFKKLNDPTKIG